VAIKNNNFDLIIDDSIPEGLLGDTTKLANIYEFNQQWIKIH
jgi:hypothetical protein